MENAENNKLIALFMGWQYKNDWWERPVGDKMVCAYRATGEIHFHDYWGELMPVVEKIEAFGYAIIDIHREATRINVYDGEECIWKTMQWNQESKINHVYQAVIKFIEWHNKSNQ